MKDSMHTPHTLRLPKWLSLLCLLAITCPSFAGLRLPSILGPNMVLQQQLPARIWGWSTPGDEVAVDFADQHKTGKADAQGAWQLTLDPMPASAEPRTLKVTSKSGEKTIELKNVLVGEVWVCAGQSNMGTAMSSFADIPPADLAESFPNLRYATLRLLSAFEPKVDTPATSWAACEKEQIGYVSATAFYFGRDLHRHLKVPVGLVVASIGGTPIESWTPRDVFERDDETHAVLEKWEKLLIDTHPDAIQNYDEYHQKWFQSTLDAYQAYLIWQKETAAAKAAGKEPPPQPVDVNRPPFNYWGPTTVYNGMIAPLSGLTIRGVIWYQGESGSSTGSLEINRKLFNGMIPAWRNAWGLGDFPFLVVQLPYINRTATDPNERGDWAGFRELQRLACAANPNAISVVTVDTGDDTNLHPSNKDVVGSRLALAARASAYGEKIVYIGPLVHSAELAGGDVRVRFKQIGSGLVSKSDDGKLGDSAPVKGFALAGADGKFAWVDATISGDTVILNSDKITSPLVVRYGFADHPVCTLFNREGLPASPFEIKLTASK